MPRLFARTPGEAWKHREIVGYADVPVGCAFGGPTYGGDSSSRRVAVSAPATDDARRWIGWGTALKPAWEPIVVARKPLGGTVAQNVYRHGTGALNIDGCRIAIQSDADESKTKNRHANYGSKARKNRIYGRDERSRGNYDPPGRWPANVVLSHTTDCRQIGHARVRSNGHYPAARGAGGLGTAGHEGQRGLTERSSAGELVGCWECSPDCAVRMLDEHGGGVSRFFYCAKASRSERNTGLGGLDQATIDDGRPKPIDNPYQRGKTPRQNIHPTVKPIALMRHLVRLVTPPGGVVLDPFTGSGSTGIAAVMEGARFLGIEREADYTTIARARIKHWAGQPGGRQR
jgi:site-specific DNA-methyltransferase (adenine-specific)